MTYKHTQVGYLMIYVLIAVIALFGFIIKQDPGAPWPAIIVMVFTVFVLTSFTTLTVIIDNQYLRIKFGYGLFRKKFALDQIESVKATKHKWYYGWGIRFCPSPKMWIYNISGFDVVEVVMKDGKTYRIGTDEPEKLAGSIK
ncbi:hypothetical protein KJ673_04125 [Patescibacteria group bacterium]|nr:hypothetical protein [Patescibacteria group bacterium]MCG2687210.1 hypothetical protein [Candidatus Parcubacteria bacterium]